MPNIAPAQQAAYLVDSRRVETFNVLGPTIQLLTPPGEDENAPCVMRGVIPPGAFVPLHSHPDPETFVSISGGFEGLVQSPGDFEWLQIMPGGVFHVPSGAKHAFRNQSSVPAVAIVISTQKMGRFFREVGMRANQGSNISTDAIRHFLEIAERYGYWNANPEQNAQIGISFSSASVT